MGRLFPLQFNQSHLFRLWTTRIPVAWPLDVLNAAETVHIESETRQRRFVSMHLRFGIRPARLSGTGTIFVCNPLSGDQTSVVFNWCPQLDSYHMPKEEDDVSKWNGPGQIQFLRHCTSVLSS